MGQLEGGGNGFRSHTISKSNPAFILITKKCAKFQAFSEEVLELARKRAERDQAKARGQSWFRDYSEKTSDARERQKQEQNVFDARTKHLAKIANFDWPEWVDLFTAISEDFPTKADLATIKRLLDQVPWFLELELPARKLVGGML